MNGSTKQEEQLGRTEPVHSNTVFYDVNVKEEPRASVDVSMDEAANGGTAPMEAYSNSADQNGTDTDTKPGETAANNQTAPSEPKSAVTRNTRRSARLTCKDNSPDVPQSKNEPPRSTQPERPFEQDTSSANILCDVVADFNVPLLDDYMMTPHGDDNMEDSHEELESPVSGGSQSPGSNGSSTSKSRITDPSKLVSLAAKKARNMGEAYVSPDGTVVVKARKMGPGCGFSCRYKCRQKISEERRKEIFSQFWRMGNHSRRWDFISKHIKVTQKKTTSSNGSKRQTSRVYYFRVGSTEAQVCKTMFTHTLGVWDNWIDTAIRKSQSGGGAEFLDLRGKYKTNVKRKRVLKPLSKASAINHIKMFKLVEDRDGEKSDRQVLEEGLHVTAMHKLYLEWMAGQEVKPVSFRQYRDVLNTEFKLSSYVPKRDNCCVCSAYNSASPEEKPSLEKSYQEHVRIRARVKELKAGDAQEAKAKGNSFISMACFDMQKVLCTPCIRNPLLHYKHKLSVYNFTVCDVGSYSGYCFVWHEGVGRISCNEVASFLLQYIEMKTGEGVTEFRFYCDDGYGLNKNKAVLAMLTLGVATFSVKITLRYIEKGHSQNETHNMHNLIEKRAKDYELYVPDDWIKVMESAKNWTNPQGEALKPYTVIEVTQEMIYDFSVLADKLNLDVDINCCKIPWSEVREVSFDSSDSTCFTYKLDFDGPPVKVCTESARRPVDYTTFALAKAYDGELAIPQAKLNDILSVCNGVILPSRYSSFYKSLKSCSKMKPSEVTHHSSDSEGPLEEKRHCEMEI